MKNKTACLTPASMCCCAPDHGRRSLHPCPPGPLPPYLPSAEPHSGRSAPPGSSASRDESWPKRRSALAAAGAEAHHTHTHTPRPDPVRSGPVRPPHARWKLSAATAGGARSRAGSALAPPLLTCLKRINAADI